MNEVPCNERMPDKKGSYKVWYTIKEINGNLTCSSQILEFDGVRFFNPNRDTILPCSNFHCWDYWEDWTCPQCDEDMFMCENPNKSTFRCVYCGHIEW